MPKASAITMLPYQQRWIDDKSRFKIANKARQIGYTFGSTYELVEACLSKPMVPWYYLSTGERQAIEAIETAQKHAAAFKAATRLIAEDFTWEGERFKSLKLEFPNGSKMVGLPANPRTARGSSGNLVLDEFAHHRDPRGIWRAIAPLITRGFRVLALSTPNGKQGKYYELWTHGKRWSRHQVDIYQAKKEGLNVDIEELREFVGNDDDWAQEYCCKFLDEAHAWITYDLLDAAEDPGASLALPPSFKPEGACFLGYDVGRKRDLSVLWLKELIADVFWTRMVKVMHKAPFRDQLDAVDAVMPFVRRACIDATGMGLPVSEEAQRRWGIARVEAVNFTSSTKEDMATNMRAIYEDRRVRNPYDAELRADVHSVRRVVTSAGNFRFDADRSDAGHADRFWAGALALHASTAAVAPFTYERVVTMRSASLFSPDLDEDDDEPGSMMGSFDQGVVF